MACRRSSVRSRLAPPPPPSFCDGLFFPAFLSPSSRGRGHRPFTAVTGVRIPLGTPVKSGWLVAVAIARHHTDLLCFHNDPFEKFTNPVFTSANSRLTFNFIYRLQLSRISMDCAMRHLGPSAHKKARIDAGLQAIWDIPEY